MNYRLPRAAIPLGLPHPSWWNDPGRFDAVKTASFWLIPFVLWPVGIVGIVNGDELLLRLFSPLANIVWTYGAWSQFKELQAVPPEGALNYATHIFVFLSHLSVVFLFWQQPRSPAGGGVAAGILLLVFLIYFSGLVHWPYVPPPLETLVLVGSLVIAELV